MRSIFLIVAGFFASADAAVMEVVPVGYSTSQPAYVDSDAGGVELIDGIVAEDNWFITGEGEKFAVWGDSDSNNPEFSRVVTFTFSFNDVYKFGRVRIIHNSTPGFGQIDYIERVDVNGAQAGVFDYAQNTPAPEPILLFPGSTRIRGVVAIDIDLSGLMTDELALTLYGSDVFMGITEVDFFTAAEVPLPPAALLLASGFLPFLRKTRRQKSPS